LVFRIRVELETLASLVKFEGDAVGSEILKRGDHDHADFLSLFLFEKKTVHTLGLRPFFFQTKIKKGNPRPMSTLQNFRTYELSILFYRDCKVIKLPHAMPRNEMNN
jgi:hypothetical protein